MESADFHHLKSTHGWIELGNYSEAENGIPEIGWGLERRHQKVIPKGKTERGLAQIDFVISGGG